MKTTTEQATITLAHEEASRIISRLISAWDALDEMREEAEKRGDTEGARALQERAEQAKEAAGWLKAKGVL